MTKKNQKKKQTSEVINKIIPNFKPFITILVCIPENVDSRITSRHHTNIDNTIIIIPNIIHRLSDE